MNFLCLFSVISLYGGLLLFQQVLSSEGTQGCDLKPSIRKGASYFRRMTPWGQWLDMPCALGTVYIDKKCACGHASNNERQSKLIEVLSTSNSISNGRETKPLESAIQLQQNLKLETPQSPTSTSIFGNTLGVASGNTQDDIQSSPRSTTPRQVANSGNKEYKPTTNNPESKMKTRISLKTPASIPSNSISINESTAHTPIVLDKTQEPKLPSTSQISEKAPSTKKPPSLTDASPQTSNTSTTVSIKPHSFISLSDLEKLSSHWSTVVKGVKLMTTTPAPSTITTNPVHGADESNGTKNTSVEMKGSTTVIEKTHDGNKRTGVASSDPTTIPMFKTHTNDDDDESVQIISSTSKKSVTSQSTSLNNHMTHDHKRFSQTTPHATNRQNDDQADDQKVFVMSEYSANNDDVTELLRYYTSTYTPTSKQFNSITTTLGNAFRKTTPVVSSRAVPSTTKTISVSTTKNPKSACELKEVVNDKTSYMGFVNDDIGWIQFQCPTGQEFSSELCWCYDPRVPTTARVSTFIPPDCQYFKEGRKTFKEYIDVLQSWVYSECSEGYLFSQLRCGCVLAETLPESEKDDFQTASPIQRSTAGPTSTAKIPDGCMNIAEGPHSFKSYVGSLGIWVYSDCPTGAFFDQSICGCVTPEEKTKKDCPYKKYGSSSYTHYVANIGDNVYYQCPDNHVFDEILCVCIAKGSRRLRSTKRTTAPPLGKISPVTKPFNPGKVPKNCKKIADSRTSYKEYVDILKDWVYSDCALGQVFIQARCGCFAQDDVGIPTTQKPNIVTNKVPKPADCDKEATGSSSFKQFIKQINDWVYSDCPPNNVFNQTKCECVLKEPTNVGVQDKHHINSDAKKEIRNDEESFIPIENNKTDKVNKNVSSTNDTLHTNMHNITKESTENINASALSGDISIISDEIADKNYTIRSQQSLDKVVFDGEGTEKFENDLFLTIEHAQLVKVKGPNVTESACSSIPTSKTTFKTYIPAFNDYVISQCPNNQVFSAKQCKCITGGGDDDGDSGLTVAPTTTTTEGPFRTIDPKCPYMAKGTGYGKYLPQIGDWVYYECPSGSKFSVDTCSCNEPVEFIGSTDCEYQKAENGQYRKFIKQLNQWIYYECPIGKSFRVKACQCVNEGDSVTVPDDKGTEGGGKCMSKSSNMGEEYFLISYPEFGEILYTCDFGYYYSQKDCGCIPRERQTSKTTQSTFINPSCALQPSDKGPGYFRMKVSDTQWIDLACPQNERFSESKCSCFPLS